MKSVPLIQKGKRVTIPLIMTIIRDCGSKKSESALPAPVLRPRGGQALKLGNYKLLYVKKHLEKIFPKCFSIYNFFLLIHCVAAHLSPMTTGAPP